MKAHSILFLAFFSLTAPLFAGPGKPIPLWPKEVPGEAKLQLPPESEEDKNNDGIVRVSNVSQPTITFYPAPADKNTGATVLVCPGGGYNILAISHEGSQVCEWLNSIGVNGVLLKYRVPRREGLEKHLAPLQDAQRAMSLVRMNAGQWKIDPNRIGILGFSAGGHLATMALTAGSEDRTYPTDPEIDKHSCQPNFAVLVYPAYLKSETDPNVLAEEFKVTKDTPPVFMVIAHDDKRFAPGNAMFYLALAEAGVPTELHIFAKGGHGFGMKKTGNRVANWPALAGAWMKECGFLSAGSPPVGVIKAADYEVVLHTGPDGPLYTIKDATGKELASEIDRKALAAEFPELNEELKGLWAGNDTNSVPTIPLNPSPAIGR